MEKTTSFNLFISQTLKNDTIIKIKNRRYCVQFKKVEQKTLFVKFYFAMLKVDFFYKTEIV